MAYFLPRALKSSALSTEMVGILCREQLGVLQFSRTAGMRVNHNHMLGRHVGQSRDLALPETPDWHWHWQRQAPPAADDQQTASSVTQYPNLTHLHLNPPLSIRQASPRTTRRSSCRPCKQVRSSTARRSSDTSTGPPSLITPSTPHTNIERFSIQLHQHLLTLPKLFSRGLHVCPRRSFSLLQAPIAHHGCATERRALPHRRPH